MDTTEALHRATTGHSWANYGAINEANNYEDTAQAWAYHLNKPFPIDPYEVTMCLQLITALWRDIYPETIESIELDPIAFSDRVSDYRYHLHANNSVEY